MKLYDNTPKMNESWIVHHVGYKCNNKCDFCIVKYKQEKPQPTTNELKYELNMLEGGPERIYFTGGEPTLREDLPFLAEYASRYTKKIWLQSNARKFHEKNYLKAFGDTLHGALVSFHTSDEQEARKILGSKKALRESIEGIKILIENGIDVETNTVLTKQNLGSLQKTIEFIYKNFEEVKKIRIAYAAFNPKNSLDRFTSLTEIKDTLIKVIEEHPSILEVENVPLCIVDTRKYKANFSDGWKIKILANKKISPIKNQRKYLPACEECSASSECQGLYLYYDTLFDPNLELKAFA